MRLLSDRLIFSEYTRNLDGEFRALPRSRLRELARKPVPFVMIEQNEAKATRYGSEWLTMVGDATVPTGGAW